ncbi:hypothetical protein ACWCQK_32845 [Streptomyces sp. NPDC002306]
MRIQQFRPARCESLARGGVVEAWVAQRLMANRNLFQLKMKQISEVKAIPRHGHRPDDTQQHGGQSRAVHLSRIQDRLRHLGEKRTHHPHGNRQIHGGVENDQRLHVVDHPDLLDDQVDPRELQDDARDERPDRQATKRSLTD